MNGARNLLKNAQLEDVEGEGWLIIKFDVDRNRLRFGSDREFWYYHLQLLLPLSIHATCSNHSIFKRCNKGGEYFVM